MLACDLCDPSDPELVAARLVARERCHEINSSHPREENQV